jgi:hypothetical protein
MIGNGITPGARQGGGLEIKELSHWQHLKNNAPSSDQRQMGAGGEAETQLLAGLPGGLNSTNTGVLWGALAD